MTEISFLGIKINFNSGELSVFGYKFRILTLVLIYILYLITFGHVLCSCCTMGLGEIREYFDNVDPNCKGVLCKKTE